MVTTDRDRDDHAPTREVSCCCFSGGGGGRQAAACVRSGGRPAVRGLRSGARQTFRSFSRRLAAAAVNRVGTVLAACRRRFCVAQFRESSDNHIIILYNTILDGRLPIRIDSRPHLCVRWTRYRRVMSSSSQPPCRRFIIGLFLIAAIVQVLYRPAQCSTLIKYLSTEYNLSNVSTRTMSNYCVKSWFQPSPCHQSR